MRLFAISDLHGSKRAVNELALIILDEQPDRIVFLGDGRQDAYELSDLIGKEITVVKGNCDLASSDPNEMILMLDSVKTLICHGHTYGVKTGYGKLESASEKAGCALALCGHTHQPMIQQRENVLIVNPGSAGAYFGATFADIKIENTDINAEIRIVETFLKKL
ncbi:MAG: YfcE family phosphodiesterase [Clostridiales bacterium]|nr:YfcE family phosphodiesterase [Clostridiales bacterium]